MTEDCGAQDDSNTVESTVADAIAPVLEAAGLKRAIVAVAGRTDAGPVRPYPPVSVRVRP